MGEGWEEGKLTFCEFNLYSTLKPRPVGLNVKILLTNKSIGANNPKMKYPKANNKISTSAYKIN